MIDRRAWLFLFTATGLLGLTACGASSSGGRSSADAGWVVLRVGAVNAAPASAW